MKNLILISGGAIAGVAIGLAVVVAALALVIFLVLKKKTNGNGRHGSKDFIEFSGDNTELLKVVDLGAQVQKKTTAIVPPTHNALIIRNGSIVKVCSEGEFPLNESGVTVRSLKVVYISKTAKVTINWGTKLYQRIQYFEPQIKKPLSVGAFGVMDVRVSDPRKFYLELVANSGQVFSVEDMQDRIRTIAVDDTFLAIGKVLNEKQLSYIQFSSAKYDIQTQVGSYLSNKFTDEFGFAVSNFIIENLNITKEQEEEIKQMYAEDSLYEREKVLYARKQEAEERERQAERRRKEAFRDDMELDDLVYGHERDRAREREEYERKNRHAEEDRAWVREDKARDYQERMQGKFLDAAKEVAISQSEAARAEAQYGAALSAGNAGHHCSVCGSSYKPGAKYCPGCGAVVPRENVVSECPMCKGQIPWGTTFCPYCGHKFGQ